MNSWVRWYESILNHLSITSTLRILSSMNEHVFASNILISQWSLFHRSLNDSSRSPRPCFELPLTSFRPFQLFANTDLFPWRFERFSCLHFSTLAVVCLSFPFVRDEKKVVIDPFIDPSLFSAILIFHFGRVLCYLWRGRGIYTV